MPENKLPLLGNCFSERQQLIELGELLATADLVRIDITKNYELSPYQELKFISIKCALVYAIAAMSDLASDMSS